MPVKHLFLILAACLLISCSPKDDVVILRDQPHDTLNLYIGAVKCSECHQKEFSLWQQSHHYYSMMEAYDSTVLGNFEDQVLISRGITTRFFKKGSQFMVNTAGRNGDMENFRIMYTFGFDPLQQYLVELEDGKIQALRYAWDVNKKSWFDLYPEQDILTGEWLHWTKGAMNWNTMCAECHTTGYQKNYDLNSDSYNSRFSEINVSCETCHGPGEKHIAGVRDSTGYQEHYLNDLSSQQTEIRACFSCHARKSNITDNPTFSGELLDDYIPEILREGLYHADGQILDEVYVWGSFAQSKMYQREVKCTDCHDPHSMDLKKKGNQLCLQCHETTYDQSSHSFHDDGISCVDCHMTGKYYMQVDFRRDHSFRIPRPDQSLVYGTPNACTECHSDKTNQWAANKITDWYGDKRDFHYSEALLKGRYNTGSNLSELQSIAFHDSTSPMVLATAVNYIARLGEENLLDPFLSHPKPLVRYYATRGMAMSAQGPDYTLKMLKDSVRAIRITAAELLNGIEANSIPIEFRSAYNKADYELKQFLEGQADFPTGQFSLGQYHYLKGNIDEAEYHFLKALVMDTLLLAARENLARIANAKGNNARAIELLSINNKLDSMDASAPYSLALIYAELGDLEKSVDFLEKTLSLDNSNERAYYNLGAALQQLDQPDQAVQVYKDGLSVLGSSDMLEQSLAVLLIRLGKATEAKPYVEGLLRKYPGNPDIKELARIVNLN